MKKRIAVIGSGISGLVSAYLLSQRYDITLYEANDYLGGHTHTIDINIEHEKYAVDTGFIVFNKKTYPNFCKLMSSINIDILKSEMSFSYCSDHSALEYNGHNLNTLFADRGNLFNPAFYRFIKDIIQFNHDAKSFLANNHQDISIREFTQSKGYKQLFLDVYLIPVIASIWSKNTTDVWNCSARFLFQFFFNHGLLNVINRPQWYVISGGSRSYISALTAPFKNNIFLNTKIEKIERQNNTVILCTKEARTTYDAVVIATHSDQALKMLEKPTENEASILGAIPYTENEAILHTDTSILPTCRRAWASWNYYDIGRNEPTLTYYMNRLQNIRANEDILLSVNLADKINPAKILRKMSYGHPCFNKPALNAQKRYAEINGKNNTYYCGAYWGNGFHEDGVNSALEVCRRHGITL